MLSEATFIVLTMLADALAAAVAVAGALVWASAAGVSSVGSAQLWLFVPLLVGWLVPRGLYRRQLRISFLDEWEPLETAAALCAITLLAIMLVLGDHPRPGELVIRCWLLAAVTVPLARLGRALVQRHARRRCKVGTPTLILGGGRVAHQIARRLRELPEYGLRPVGLLDRDPAPALAGDDGVPVLGEPAELVDVTRATGARHLIVAFTRSRDEELVPVARVGQEIGMAVSLVPRFFDSVGAHVRVEHLGGLPLMNLHRTNPCGWQFLVKHAMDRTLAGIGLLLAAPLLLLLALLVRMSSPGPIFFRQRRIGRDGQPFDLLKFRSMRLPSETGRAFTLKAGAAPGGVEGEDRRTRVGTFMRRTSLDELPQLLNVVRGEMSLVGPRPERPDFVELFEMQIRRYGDRHRVKAGITGWAQVHGLRGQTSIADRAEWDNYYIENWSLRLDLKILPLTVLTLFRRSED